MGVFKRPAEEGDGTSGPWPRRLLNKALSATETHAGQEKADEIRASIDRLVRRMRGTPWLHRDHFEVCLGTWGGVLRMVDDTGRLLGENHGLPYGAKTHPTILEKTSTFPGSRRGKPYNASALKQMGKDWPPAKRLMAHLRAAYLRDVGVNARPLPLVELQVLARIVTAYPAYAFRRARRPLCDGEMPSVAASAFKVMAGVHATLEPMVREGPPAGLAVHEVPDVEVLFRFIEDGGLFISGEGWVCAGPERLVRDVLHLGVFGGDDAYSDIVPDAEELPALVRYGRTVAAIELLLLLAAELEHGASDPEASQRILGAVRHVVHAPGSALLSGERPPTRAALIEARAELSATAAGHLGQPAPRESLQWSGFVQRL